MRKLIILLALIEAAVIHSAAQIYVTDNCWQDSVEVYTIEWDKEHATEISGKLAFKLPMGEEVAVTELLTGNTQPRIAIDGKEYTISKYDLLFSEKNPEGTKDILGDTRKMQIHTAIGHFFASATPYWIISILFVIAALALYLGIKSAPLRPLALRVTPVALLLATSLEVWAYSVWGSDIFWWCDPDHYGFFGALFRVIPFALFVTFQLVSIKYYSWLLIGKEKTEEISWKPLFIGMAACIPVFVISVCLLAVSGIKGDTNLFISLAAFFVSLIGGLLYTGRKNTQILGKSNGIMFTIFAAVYFIGAIISIWGLILVLFKLIIQILMIIAAIFGVAFAFSSKSGEEQKQMLFYDKSGTGHITGVDRDAANRRIDERRENGNL